jgi:CBS-domain-containing membrane protein
MEQSTILREVPVQEIMSRDVQTAEPDLDAAEAARLLLENKFGCLPVVADGDRLVGIVTEADFVELAVHYLELHGTEETDTANGSDLTSPGSPDPTTEEKDREGDDGW